MSVFLVILTCLGAVFAGAAFWVRKTFGLISVDQMMMNIGGGGTDVPESYLSSFLVSAVFLPLLILVLLSAAIWAVLRRTSLHRKETGQLLALKTQRGAKARFNRLVGSLVALTMFVVGIVSFGQAVGLSQFARSLTTPLTMDEYYVAPVASGTAELVNNQDAVPKNLVLIFLESGEADLSDDSLFELNMNAPVESVTAGWQSFEELAVYPGGGWTMAGLVGTSCGVPLRGPGVLPAGVDKNEIGSDASGFMGGATCLGDVLSAAGYSNVFLGGADNNFASKGQFFSDHGYEKVMGLEDWKSQGETELSSWGLSDRRLMEVAKEEVARLHSLDEPFNLTVLTVDTHEPVYEHEYCPVTTEEAMESIFYCSSTQVADFINFLEEEGILEDTVVMVTGDHLKMLGESGIFVDELAPIEDRSLFNRLWVPDGADIQRGSIDQLSVYATLLDVLGLPAADGRAGVGVSAMREDGLRIGALALAPADYESVLISRSADLYAQLWKPSDGDSISATAD